MDGRVVDRLLRGGERYRRYLLRLWGQRVENLRLEAPQNEGADEGPDALGACLRLWVVATEGSEEGGEALLATRLLLGLLGMLLTCGLLDLLDTEEIGGDGGRWGEIGGIGGDGGMAEGQAMDGQRRREEARGGEKRREEARGGERWQRWQRLRIAVALT